MCVSVCVCDETSTMYWKAEERLDVIETKAIFLICLFAHNVLSFKTRSKFFKRK